MKLCKKGKTKQNAHFFFPHSLSCSNIRISSSCRRFCKLLTVDQGSIQVVAAFFLAISKQLYRKNLHQDKVVPLLS